MKHKIDIGCYMLLAAFTFACGGSTTEQATGEEKAEIKEVKKKEIPRTGVSVIAEVQDIEAWVAVYKDKAPEEIRIAVLQSADNSNLLNVIEWTESHAASKERFASEETKSALVESGIIGDLDLRHFDLKYINEVTSTDEYRLAVSHEVTDFESWKLGFDGDKENRMSMGLTLLGMSTSADNPKMVNMVFGTNDQDKVIEVMSSEEMQQTMMDAGVVGEPVISWWRVLPID
jgi:hypothetical protein